MNGRESVPFSPRSASRSHPLYFPCYYGIDFTGGELIAYKHSVEEIRQFIGVDDLHYLTLEGLLKATNLGKDNFCLACFTGDYPVKVEGDISKYCFESP